MMIVNDKYKINKEWLDLMLKNKNNINVTFNLSDNDTRILLIYIEFLQQENARLKDKIENVIEYANSDEFEQLFESCANFNEANCNINHFLKEN